MATVSKVVRQDPNTGGKVWGNTAGTPLVNGDQSVAIGRLWCRPEMSWQVTGTFGAGGSVQLEESNDATNWTINGTAATAAAFKPATVTGRFVRFNVTAGDGSTALVVTLAGTQQNE